MKSTTKRSIVAPVYAAAATWLLYAVLFPLYQPLHFIGAGSATAIVFFVALLVCRSGAKKAEANEAKRNTASQTAEKQPETTASSNPALDKMLSDGKLAIAEMKRLDENISDEGISADIVRLEQVSQKIFDEVKHNPEKLPQIRKFMDYYLPTTLKLLNSYDRMSNTGISGENIDNTLAKVESMMRTIVAAFEKQLDSLYSADALDISTDIKVLETMMAREGLTEEGQPLKAESTESPQETKGIELKL